MASRGSGCTGAARKAALLSFVLQVSAGAVGADCYFPAVFNFGDSNSDTGGLSATFGAAPPPNGRTFFGMPVGRYCDGRLVVDFIGAVAIKETRLDIYKYFLKKFFGEINFVTEWTG